LDPYSIRTDPYTVLEEDLNPVERIPLSAYRDLVQLYIDPALTIGKNNENINNNNINNNSNTNQTLSPVNGLMIHLQQTQFNKTACAVQLHR
jgi:hypothetical protein